MYWWSNRVYGKTTVMKCKAQFQYCTLFLSWIEERMPDNVATLEWERDRETGQVPQSGIQETGNYAQGIESWSISPDQLITLYEFILIQKSNSYLSTYMYLNNCSQIDNHRMEDLR